MNKVIKSRITDDNKIIIKSEEVNCEKIIAFKNGVEQEFIVTDLLKKYSNYKSKDGRYLIINLNKAKPEEENKNNEKNYKTKNENQNDLNVITELIMDMKAKIDEMYNVFLKVKIKDDDAMLF